MGQMRYVIMGIVAAAELALVVFEEVGAKFGGAIKNSQGSVVEGQLIEHLYEAKDTRMSKAGLN